MCSIPGLPTPGSEVPVFITRVNLNPNCGLVELWVNLGAEMKHIYEQMREEIQIPERRFNGSEGKAEDLCLVCISDTWHRARILSKESETYNVFLIDQGQPHVTTGEALAWGRSDSFLLPPEIETCILANVLSLQNNLPDRASNFLKSLNGKTFQGTVQDVLMPDRIILLDIPIISKHMCRFGVARKVPVDKFKCLVQERLHLPKGVAVEVHRKTNEQNLNGSHQLEIKPQYLYPELLSEAFETVIVTEVNSPDSIFCSLNIFSKTVKTISEQIHQHYKESSDFGEATPLTCGDPCAARGKNGRWHRSLLKQNMTRNGEVEVLHVDEGKTELVPLGEIKPLHGKFLRMPVFTYPCSLNGVENAGWTAEQTNCLKSLLLNQTVLARFNQHDAPQDVYNVSLFTSDGECINSPFIEKTGLFPIFKTKQNSDVQNGSFALSMSSIVHPLGDKQCLDFKEVSEEETLPGTKTAELNGSVEYVDSSATDDVESSEHSDIVMLSNKDLQMGVHLAMHNGYDDVYAVGRTLNVKVSCIESLQRFWCQTTEKGDSLQFLMQDLQNHYASNHPQPLVESICVARNPNDNKWYRAKIITSHHYPVVDVRFIDSGQTGKVPLRDVRPIDPAFLRLHAQAFQCCLSNQSTAVAELQKVAELGALSNTGFKCTIKAVTSDDDGLPLNVVEMEPLSKNVCKLSNQKAESQEPISPQVQLDAYNYSTHNVEVGQREKVFITASENVHHFYCQLDRNSHLLKKVMENVKNLTAQLKSTDQTLGLNSICFAKYTDNQWYRGQVVQMAPSLKVHFVDYGETLAVNESDVYPFPAGECVAKSAPVQAVPLGLYNVPAEVPQEVNQWFGEQAVESSLTISVVAKDAKGKLIVELFAGSHNVNMEVRERVLKLKQQNGLPPQTDQQPSVSIKPTECVTEELMNTSVFPKITEDEIGLCVREELKQVIESIAKVSVTQVEHGMKPTLEVILEAKESMLAESFIQSSHSDSETSKLSPTPYPKENINICKPNFSPEKTKEVYASSISGPNYFWCQLTNTEDLNLISILAQEAGKANEDIMFSKTFDTGTQCLALFSSDNQWYRAQVISRTESLLNVVFIDYGNESEVDMKNVRPLPPSLLEKAPQAFLCSLNGFDESKGSWDDDVYDDFYNILIDKPLEVTVFYVEDHSEIGLPQYAVQIQCDNVLVNEAMQKHWKAAATEHVESKSPQIENSIQSSETDINSTQLSISKENQSPCKYKKPTISKNKDEEVYGSCIVNPHYFWCQFANTEELDLISSLVQEAQQKQQDSPFPATLVPGSSCLALFSSDEQWYRAQVITRVDDTLHVLFIDYGNESDVDIKNVRPLPQTLLEKTPQAFLCSLNGFDVSNGSWNDEASDDFYNFLVDKPLKVKVYDMKDHSDTSLPQYAVEIECEGVIVNEAMQKHWKMVDKDEDVSVKSPQTESFLQSCQAESNKAHPSFSNGKMNACKYKEPEVSRSKTEMLYGSCIVEPHYFWCQFANTEELNKISSLVQGAGQEQQDSIFPETLVPGSPCLALFSSDEQWYRAQVVSKDDNAFHVVFIDYGNETDIDIKNVRPLPQSLLEKPPQAFLCSLNGFDASRGSWDDSVYDDYYNLLVDKPLKLTVLGIDKNAEVALPQYKVEIECNGEVVNTQMEKYWKRLDTDFAEGSQSVDQDEEEC